jgi:hypothetical protein
VDLINSFLHWLHEKVSRFIVPSAALWDLPTLEAQIELRQRALADFDVIRRRLLPFMRSEIQRRLRKGREPGVRRSRIGDPCRRYG